MSAFYLLTGGRIVWRLQSIGRVCQPVRMSWPISVWDRQSYRNVLWHDLSTNNYFGFFLSAFFSVKIITNHFYSLCDSLAHPSSYSTKISVRPYSTKPKRNIVCWWKVINKNTKSHTFYLSEPPDSLVPNDSINEFNLIDKYNLRISINITKIGNFQSLVTHFIRRAWNWVISLHIFAILRHELFN